MDTSSAKVESGVKRCCRCGKDLTGHKRYKDHLGYWCRTCHTTDRKMASTRIKFDRKGKDKKKMIALISAGAVVALVLLYLLIR